MECGRPEKDFICKAIAGHTGMVGNVVLCAFPLLTPPGRVPWDLVFSH